MSQSKKLGAKEKLAQKVLVRTVNEFLRRGVFTPEPAEDAVTEPVIEFDMDGIPAIAHAHNISHGEISIKVALWPTDMGREMIGAAVMAQSHKRKMGGFYTSAWFERKDRAWLQTSSGLSSACGQKERPMVESIASEEPAGFSTDGKF